MRAEAEAECRFGVRVTSNRNGSANTPLSRLADISQ